MRNRVIKIILADDHILIRKGIKLILESENDIKVIEEARDGNEAINKVLHMNPDIVIMDINMPVLNGIGALNKLKELGVQTKVIILTGDLGKENIITATKIGARGYLLKNCEPSCLIKAIREVFIGRSYIDLAVANILTYGNQTDINNNHLETQKIKRLTKREYEVLVKLSEGYDNKSIGKKLFISEKTVKNHITQVFKKLEVIDRVQAALFAYNNIIN